MKGARLITGIILGIVLTVAGYYSLRSFCLFSGARTHLIRVGPSGDITDPDEEEAYISLTKKNQITWQSTDGSPLIIEFDTAELKSKLNNKDPFQKMIDSPDKKYRRVYCTGDECRSNDINAELASDLGSFACPRVKYYQQAGSRRADGWIIIKP